MLDALATIRQRVANRRTHHEQTLAGAAIAIAAGREIDVGAVENALAQTGITPEQFEARVALHRERNAKRDALAKLAAAQKLRGELEERGQRATTKFECEWKKHSEAMEQLQAEKHKADAVISEALAARAFLLDTRNAPEAIASQLTSAREARRLALETVGRLESTIRDLQGQISLSARWLEQFTKTPADQILALPDNKLVSAAEAWTSTDDDAADRYLKKLRRARTDLATAEPQLNAAQAEAKAAETALAAIEAQALAA